MPVDPGIALSVQGVAPMANPLQLVSQAQNLQLQRQAMQAQLQERQAQAANLQAEAQARQQTQANNATLDRIMRTAYSADPDTGAMVLDPNRMQQEIVNAGLGHLWPTLSESIDKMNKSAMDMNAQRRQTLASTLYALQQTPDAIKPHAALTALAGLRANQVITSDHAQAALQQLGPNPTADQVNQVIQQYGAAMPEFQKITHDEQERQAKLGLTRAQTAEAAGKGAESVATAAVTQRGQAAGLLASATSAQDYATKLAMLSPDQRGVFPPPQAWTPQLKGTLLKMGQTAEQQVTAAQAAATLAETARYHQQELALQDPSNPKRQDALEQQARMILQKEFSGRTGGLGTQDAKVNQAVHLTALMDQYKDAKGNYNIPQAQYAELAQGLASIISPTGQPTDAMRNEITARTLKGDIAGLGTYLTGTPFTGSTQAIFQNLRDSIARQGNVAQTERQRYLDAMANMLPTDLNADRRAKLLQAQNLTTMQKVGDVVTVGGQKLKITAIHGDGTFDGDPVK